MQTTPDMADESYMHYVKKSFANDVCANWQDKYHYMSGNAYRWTEKLSDLSYLIFHLSETYCKQFVIWMYTNQFDRRDGMIVVFIDAKVNPASLAKYSDF